MRAAEQARAEERRERPGPLHTVEGHTLPQPERPIPGDEVVAERRVAAQDGLGLQRQARAQGHEQHAAQLI
ncbi:MAG: hypothetical protein IPO67_26625 [Deltaproteobacteria bacterium]|nr:hypothetical protein [Deltaproteobacteria bacterium]